MIAIVSYERQLPRNPEKQQQHKGLMDQNTFMFLAAK
jgi:hypothetical protein